MPTYIVTIYQEVIIDSTSAKNAINEAKVFMDFFNRGDAICCDDFTYKAQEIKDFQCQSTN